MAGEQAIPLLLRVRQLDPRKLPRGAELIEKATASKDRAALMPPGWIDRQMKQGRVLFMLDGLDETEPELRDQYILPWLLELCQQYPNCRYLVSSRPVGYPPGTLRGLEFAECNLLDFGEPEIADYCRHWCTAVRLARNEPEEEARREGTADGKRIADGFEGHPYIRNLARNPLMLSAICLVNYFEGGTLPKDRALLYRLCVEGLLHHWDQRRGIHSEFTLDEKLRTCREVALAMQADDRAEYNAHEVQDTFAHVLSDPARANKLLEHVRYRTGLLLERRAGVFAFAHLTFQEYLAARAVHEGNRLGIHVERLASEHGDGRWNEVIALYCGLAPSKAAREMIECIIAQPDSRSLSAVLAEAYLSAGPDLSRDHILRRKILERIARAPGTGPPTLDRFPTGEVAPIANRFVGKTESDKGISEAYHWMYVHPGLVNWPSLAKRLREWRRINPTQAAELIHLSHAFAPNTLLTEIASDAGMYAAPRPNFGEGLNYLSQAEVALLGLEKRKLKGTRTFLSLDTPLLQILRVLSRPERIGLPIPVSFVISEFFDRRSKLRPPQDATTWPEFASLARQLANDLDTIKGDEARWGGARDKDRAINALKSWAVSLERAIAASDKQISKSKTTGKPTAKKRAKRR